jgi:diacylglycerol kinase family enzyme
MPAIGLCGGDLWRTLGGTAGRDPSSQDAVAVVVDVGSVLLDGRQHWFVAHLVARRSWWRGRTFAAMNAQFLGTWDVAPRAHPGDGRLDVLDADLDLRARLGARRRLRHGTHVPHPGIREQRLTAWQGTFEPALPVRLDGEPAGTVHNVSLRVEPASLTVHL